MLSYSIWFSAPSVWMGDVLESRCVDRVFGAVHGIPYTRPTQRLSRPPPIQKLGAENRICNSTSNAPVDGRMRPKHVELRIHR